MDKEIEEIIKLMEMVRDSHGNPEELRMLEEKFETAFNDSSTSFWEVGYEEVVKTINELRASGVEEIDEYFDDHAEEVVRLLGSINTIRVNDASVKLVDADSQKDLIRDISKLSTEDVILFFKQVLHAIAAGQLSFDYDIVTTSLNGSPIKATVLWRAVEDTANPYSHVFIASIDKR